MNDRSVVSSAAAEVAVAAPPSEFRVSEGYRQYVLWLLFAIYVFNFADRSILAVLVQPIKAEFGLSDAQLGILGGLAFALLYSTLGIPLARLADRGNRVSIIAASLFTWSLFTGLTGFARNFTHLLLARIAVGIGEAGCSPPAYSLIADYFEKKRRATALATYSMGISGGVFLGFMVAAGIAQAYGWRAAFFALGLPGMLLSVVVKLTLREPPRGFSDGVVTVADPPPVAQVLKTLWSKRAFRHLSIAAALTSFHGYGAGAFYPAFLMRTHGMSMVEVGGKLGLCSAIGGFIGAYAGGRLADALGNKHNDPRYQLWLPAVALLVNIPIALTSYQMQTVTGTLSVLVLALAVGAMYLGPTYAATQSLLAPRERALGSALLLFIINLVGLGFGPLLTGVLSDVFRTKLIAGGMSDPAATAAGLVWSLRAMIVINVWAAVHYVLAARTLRRDATA
ncbi:MAG: MFS transporter [Polyangiales bacterium]